MKNGDNATFFQPVGWTRKNIIPVKIIRMSGVKAHVKFLKTGEIKCVNQDNLTVDI